MRKLRSSRQNKTEDDIENGNKNKGLNALFTPYVSNSCDSGPL